MQERLANNNHQLEGDYWYLILHDLRTKDFKERKIDLYKELYRYDYQLQPWGWDPVYYKGKDYVAVQVTHKDAPNTQNGRSRYLFWDIEAEKFQEAPQDFDVKTYREEMDMGFGPTNLKEAMKPNNVGVLMWQISFLDTGKDFPKNRNINFYKENPSIINLMQGDKLFKVYLRKGQNTKESVFEDMRHLFAPVGQDKIDVVATNPETGEQTPINSYKDMEAWWNRYSP